ncbi:NADP-dependent oxidoreductase, partial [Halobium palmae]
MHDSNREWYFVERPDGEPDPDCFELRESDRPEPESGELLVRVRYLSVDPYMRGRMRDSESYAEPWDVGDVLQGGVVGEVVESDDDDRYGEGDLVTGQGTWSDYAVLDADDVA